MKTTQTKEYTIDANGKRLGKIASEVAMLLMGKNDPSFERHLLSGHQVKIINASKLDISERRLNSTHYIGYSGYPGGQKKESLGHVAQKKGFGELIRRAVFGMLASNRLKSKMMKNLEVTE